MRIPHSTGVGSSASSRRPAHHNSSSRSGPSSERQSDRQEVAAVCYRIGNRGLEFLLVRTRNRRWIFPKGGVEPGLTQAQSAALEAFEEAGVHGRIEEMPFARYHLVKSARGKLARKGSRTEDRSAPRNKAVTVHLCEVSHLETPQESNRRPTWFSPEKAKSRLLEDRNAEFGAELAGVVDRAVARIWRLEARRPNEGKKDSLQEVRFEAFENLRLPGDANNAALMRAFLRARRSTAGIGKVLQLQPSRPMQLGAGSRPAPHTAPKMTGS